MTPHFEIESTLGARYIVPVLPGHAAPLLPRRLNHSSFSRLSFLPALTLRNVQVAQALLPVRFFVRPLRVSEINARRDGESSLDGSGRSKQINSRAQQAFPQAQAFRAQYLRVTRTHPADG